MCFCEFLEEDEFQNVCHASDNDDCKFPFSCSAEVDIHGKYLIDYGISAEWM